LSDVGELGADEGRCLSDGKEIGQLARNYQLSPQGNLQDRGTFCRVPHEPIGFISKLLLRGGDLSGQHEQGCLCGWRSNTNALRQPGELTGDLCGDGQKPSPQGMQFKLVGRYHRLPISCLREPERWLACRAGCRCHRVAGMHKMLWPLRVLRSPSTSAV